MNFGQESDSYLSIGNGYYIGDQYPTYIIADIGNNHQGDLQIAEKLIEAAAISGADCVKLKKSDVRNTLTPDLYAMPYESEHSFADTYGKHLEKLQLDESDIERLKQYAENMELHFTLSGTDEHSFDYINKLNLPFIRIESPDCVNMHILDHVVKYGKPLIISTGMSDLSTLNEVYNDYLSYYKHNIAFLQSTACIPTPQNAIDLNVIKTYKRCFHKSVIGYSGHEYGIGISCAAVALGARIIERPLTINNKFKGITHASSLEPYEFSMLVDEIRNVEAALGSYTKEMQDCERACYDKLGKTIVTTQHVKSGTILDENIIDIKVASSKGTWKLERYYELIGRKVKRDLPPEAPINVEDVE